MNPISEKIEKYLNEITESKERTINFQGMPTTIKVKKSGDYRDNKYEPRIIHDILLKNKNGTHVIPNAIHATQGYYQNQPGGGLAHDVMGYGVSQGDLTSSKRPFLTVHHYDHIESLVNNPEKLEKSGHVIHSSEKK